MTKQIPPGYKQTKVGIIPEDWEVVKIKDATSYVDYRGKTPTKTDGGIFLVTARNIKHGFIDYQISSEFIAESEYHEIMRRGMPKIGDIIITTEAPLGNIAQIDNESIALAQRVIKLRGKKNVKNDFLKHYLLSNTFQSYLHRMAIGTTVLGIQGKELHNMLISLPPVTEQEKIAEILITWDDAITKQKQLIEQKQVFKKGIMQQIFSQKISFKDDNGSDYPAWQTFEFEDIFRRIPSKKYQINSAEYGKYGKYPVIDQGKKLIIAYSDNEEKIYKNSSIIVFGDHTRELKYVDFDFIVGADGTQLIKAKCNFDNKFLYYQLITKNIPNTGYNRHFKFLLEMVLEVPSNEEQNKIAYFLTSIDNEITKQTDILAQLKLQKQSLMQKLLTGQVRAFNYSKESA